MVLNEILLTLAIINSLALAFIYLLVGRWCITTDKKLADLKDVVYHIPEQSTSMYLKQLNSIKAWLISEEKFEEAAIVDEVIKHQEEHLNKLCG